MHVHFKPLLVAALSLVLSTRADLIDSSRSEPGSEVTKGSLACGNPGHAVPLYRAYYPPNPNHFYTTSRPEFENAVSNLGYTNEGTAGYVFPLHQPSTVPLYRLYSPSAVDHFYTTDAKERDNAIERLGYLDEGVVGYVYGDSGCGGMPLWRLYSPRARDHFYTMSTAERDNASEKLGYVKEGVAGYIFPV